MIDQTKLEALFLKAKNAPHTSGFNESKEQFLIASSGTVDKMTSKKNQFKPFIKGFIMLLITGAITLTCFLMSSDIEENRAQNTQETTSTLENEFTVEKTPIKTSRSENVKAIEKSEVFEVAEMMPLLPSTEPIAHEEAPSDSIIVKEEPELTKQTAEYVFPTLTKKQIADNNRRKKKMLKALNKQDSKVYSYIPSGSFIYKSNPVSVSAFYMQRTEVTNLEYKTFLFDLLIQDRKADFLVAKPKQELWTEELGEDYRFMQDEYFSGEDYEDHPVNNISRKGAELYCFWITREANKLNEEDGKTLINDVRIPYRVEWVKAATVEGKFTEYAWADSTSSISLLSNFSMNGYTPITGVVHNRRRNTLAYLDSSALTTNGATFSDGDILAESSSYLQNEYGLSNMCGNLAEMVYISTSSNDLEFRKSETKSGTAGGGWMNTVDEIKLNAEDLYSGVEEEHLNIGFRVVITYFNNSN